MPCNPLWMDWRKPSSLEKTSIAGENVCLVLGDNIFYGQGFRPMLERVAGRTTGATIFGYQVMDLRRFEVVTFDDNRRVLSVEEKLAHPKVILPSQASTSTTTKSLRMLSKLIPQIVESLRSPASIRLIWSAEPLM